MGHTGSHCNASMAALNNRLRQMAELDQKLEELESFNDDVRHYVEATEEMDAGDEDDEDYLMNLERIRQEKEYESLKGSIYEPSLIICWVVVSLVTVKLLPVRAHSLCCTGLRDPTHRHWGPRESGSQGRIVTSPALKVFECT